MRYSKDLMECALRFHNSGHRIEEVIEVFGIGRSTLYEWKAKERAGFPEAPKRSYERKIKNTVLLKALEEKPDSELSELAELFDCTPQAVFYALRRLNVTRKKKRSHTLKSQTKHGQSIKKN